MDPLSPCACWRNVAALGHDGHCCFLHEDRRTWRRIEEVCHRPPPPTIKPYVPLAERQPAPTIAPYVPLAERQVDACG
jgi:hypothetical protein